MEYVGTRVRRVEDPRLIQGRGCYVGDLRPPGMLVAGFVRSPHPRALLTSIDLDAARALPGVIAAYGAADLPEAGRPAHFPEHPPGLKGHGIAPLARDEVRYQGEAVAVIVAETPDALADALEAALVQYEPLEPVMGIESALNGAGPVWPDVPDNVAIDTVTGFGDVDAAFESADVVIEETFDFARSAGAAMEPRSVLAVPGGENGERLTLWTSTQAPHSVRDNLARYLGFEPDAVRVVVPDVGGGFGPKGRTYPEEYALALLALQLNRPVRWVATRTEDLETTAHGRGQRHHARLAARGDGSILALADHIVQDIGAYTPSGVIVPFNTARHLLGPYRVAAMQARVTGVYTNRVMTSPLRGGGRPQGIFVMERLLDRLADRLHLDRAEVRRRNLLPPAAFPYNTGMTGVTGPVVYDSGAYPAYLERALETIEYEGFRSRQEEARREGRYLGFGLAAFIESTGGGSEGAGVEIGEDGAVRVTVGSPDNGQGHATTFGQMAAERLGVPLERVSVKSGDTAALSWGTGTFASRMGQYGGNAVSLAAQAVREKALRLAAELLEIAKEDLQLTDGRIEVRGVPSRSLSLAAVAREARERGEPLEASRPFEQSPASTWAGGVNAAIVEVDPETGVVRILRYLVVHDAGTIVNPTIVEGQVHGGVVHGVGNALFEEILYGSDGTLRNPTFADYSLTLAGDAPTVEVVHFETPSPFNPEGIKGAGEGGTIAAIPTIVSAIEDALSPFGIRINGVPIRPEEIAKKVREARESWA